MKTRSILLYFISPLLLGDFEDTTEKYFVETNDNHFFEKNIFQDVEETFSKYKTYQTKNWMEANK